MFSSDSTHKRHIRRTGVANPANYINAVGSTTGKCTTTNGVTSGGSAGGAIHYFEIGGKGDLVTAVMLRWFDTTTSGTFTLESTNAPFEDVAFDSVNAEDWFDESATITSPSGAAKGCFMLHFGNSGARRNRIKYVAAANSEIEVCSFGKE